MPNIQTSYEQCFLFCLYFQIHNEVKINRKIMGKDLKPLEYKNLKLFKNVKFEIEL